jgi:hypothetical protein
MGVRPAIGPIPTNSAQGRGWSIAADFELGCSMDAELSGDVVVGMAVFKNAFDVFTILTDSFTNWECRALIFDGTVHRCAGGSMYSLNRHEASLLVRSGPQWRRNVVR